MIALSYLEKHILENIVPKQRVSKVANLSLEMGSNKEYLSALAKDLGLDFIATIEEFESFYTVEQDFGSQKKYLLAKTNRFFLAKNKITDTEGLSKSKYVLATSNPFAAGIHEFYFDEIVLVPEEVIDVFLPDNLDLKEQYSEKEANEYIDKILELGVNKNASDIHIETDNNNYYIKFRIDGYLSDVVDTRPIEFMNIVFKILRFRCNIDTSSIVQSLKGSFSNIINNKKFDWRFQLVQTMTGFYKVTLRKAHSFGGTVNLDKLNYYPPVLEQIRKEMLVSRGITLLSGVTGSGKTTTLYGALNELAREKKSIFTLEDPVESVFPDFTQVQISNSYSYTDGIRDALRSNPDILLIGEIRDGETAHAAFNAAITGHKSYSTLHVGSISHVKRRLTKLGLEEDVVAQNLLAIFVQRKVIKLCSCKLKDPSTGFYLANTSVDNKCPICSNSDTKGYKSIVPINESAIIKNNSVDLTRQSFSSYVSFKECLDWHLEVGNIDKKTYDSEVSALDISSNKETNGEFIKRFKNKIKNRNQQ